MDTETDGIRWPIHVVEVCAQRMRGWEPCAEPFRVWLNHDVPIPPEVVGVHGYDRAFLRKHGAEPRAAHRAFGEYAAGLPFVAHNLSFDWDRCLRPEWARLGFGSAFGQRGFCTVMLSRRVLGGEVRRHGLGALREHFGLNPLGRAHQALGDVQTTVELVRDVLGPRLRRAGLEDFAEVAAFAARTPVAACVRRFAPLPGQSAAAAARSSVSVSSQPMQASVMETP